MTGQVLTQNAAAAAAANAAMAAAAQSQQPPTHNSISNPAGAVTAHTALEFGKKRSAENDIFQNMVFQAFYSFYVCFFLFLLLAGISLSYLAFNILHDRFHLGNYKSFICKLFLIFGFAHI